MQFLLSSIILFSFVHGQNTKWIIGQAVKTTSGTLHGHPASWQTSVSEYLGVPFAQPPVGDLRWAAPKAYKNESSSFVAEKFSPDCAANVAAPLGSKLTYGSVQETVKGILGQAGDTFSEDCLTLNVWTKPQSGERAKAVLVWIYGGGFSTGNSASPAYNGARLAAENDVVVVSVNYRVNIFGFPKTNVLPDINLGLLDQRLGVEWVRDNIAAFGGDPKRITLFGQSAGGGSVDMYAYAWTKDPIVNGIIPMSGSATARAANSTTDGWYEVSSALGCGGQTAGAATVTCMRSKSYTDILAGMRKANVSGMGAFGPSADDKVVFSDYSARRDAGNFIKVPILVGNTDDEPGINFATSRPFPKFTVKRQAPTGGLIKSTSGCGPHVAAGARVKAGLPSWRYLSGMIYPNSDIGSQGCWHGGDIGYVFGTQEYLSRVPDTDDEKKLIADIMNVWTTFAKDPLNGLSKLGWPVYDGTKETVVLLGGRNSSKIKFIDRKLVDEGC